MSTIAISRSHQLSREELRQRVEALARKLESEFDARCHWEGDCLHVVRSGASGVIEMDAQCVRVSLKLGLLLRPLQGTIRQTIEETLDRELDAG